MTHLIRIDGEESTDENGQKTYQTHCGRFVTVDNISCDNERVRCSVCRFSNRQHYELKLEVDPDEIAILIDTDCYLEVVKWVVDEWVEDPSVVAVIANAIDMYHNAPNLLVVNHLSHIKSQLRRKV